MIKTNLKIRRRKRKSSYADTVESTEHRLGFTLDRAFCSSRNSFLFLLESLPPSGLPELYMNRIQLQIQAPPHHSRELRVCRLAVMSRHPIMSE